MTPDRGVTGAQAPRPGAARPAATATDSRPRRTRPARVSWPAVRAQWPLALVLTGVVVALGFVVFERWRRGALVVALVAFGSALLRWALPESVAGLLAVRSKGFDVGFLVVVGALALWLAVSIDSLGTG